jgi:hypothetical protein
MDPTPTYEKYPAWIVVLSVAMTVAIYGLGAWLLAGFSRTAV